MSTKPATCVVLFVADVGNLATFYREVAAMTMLHQEADHAILEIAGFELVIHAFYGEPSLPDTASSPAKEPVSVREDSCFKLCLPVASIAVARDRASALGGLIKAEAYEWEARGVRACDGHDPEGNVLQVRQLVI